MRWDWVEWGKCFGCKRVRVSALCVWGTAWTVVRFVPIHG